MKLMRAFIVAALSLLLSQPVFAAGGTITVKDAGGVTRTFDIWTQTSTNFIWQNTICDVTTENQCVAVTGSNALKVDGSAVTQPISGTVTANIGSGTAATNIAFIQGASPSATNPLWTAAAEATVSAGNSLNGVTANTTGTSVSVTGFGAALVDVNCSVACTGGTTVTIQASDVVGFQTVGMMPVAGQSAMVSTVVNQSGAALFCVPNFGYTNLRANVSAYSAGTISVTITPINAPGGCGVNQVANALPTGSAAFAGSSPVTAATINVTPTDCSGSISTGGTAQNAFSANASLHGFQIANLDTTEALWISFTGTAAASTTGSYPLAAATATTFQGDGSYTSPLGFGLNHALSVVAATTSHKFSCTTW